MAMNPYYKHLEDGMREILGIPTDLPGDIKKPDPIAQDEAVEGICAQGEDDRG